jgi:hypothetical protein
MKKNLFIILTALVICGCSASGPGHSPLLADVPPTAAYILDGAYELISVTTTLTKPQKSTQRLLPPEWRGMWIFHDGRFSQTLMKQRRSWNPFPTNQEELGYRAGAGTYQIEGNRLRFDYEYNLNPYGISQRVYTDFSLEGDTLSMTDNFSPHLEDLSEGQTVIVLRRLK